MPSGNLEGKVDGAMREGEGKKTQEEEGTEETEGQQRNDCKRELLMYTFFTSGEAEQVYKSISFFYLLS